MGGLSVKLLCSTSMIFRHILMLSSLSIRNIALIAAADIRFGNGVCVFTGETGAGKSMLLKSLCFAVGAASGSGLTRHGEKKGEVTLTFDHIPAGAVQLLQAHDMHDDDMPDSVILRRTVNSDGRGKAYINDTPCGVKFLKELGEQLLEIHGQHDQRGFIDAGLQRTALDRFAESQPFLSACATAYDAFIEAEKQLKDAVAMRDKISREKDYYQFAVRELEELAPEVGLEEALIQQRDTLRHAANIEEAKALLAVCFDGNAADQEGIRSLYHKALQAADTISRFVPSAAEHYQALQGALLEAEAAADCLMLNTQETDTQYQSIDALEDRLYALRTAARKYGVDTDALPQMLEDARSALEDGDSSGDREARLQTHRDHALDLYNNAASALHRRRHDASVVLSSILSSEVQALHMHGAEVGVSVEYCADKRSAHGSDHVTFLLKSNAGMPFASLSSIASGGELSRCMLAFKAALSATQQPMSMIFDEIDTGISGAVSEAVGERLRKLSDKHQIFAVTHQPQVAGAADHHFVIRKFDRNGETFTEIEELSRQEREEEVARLMSGAEISGEARNAARKLLHSSS